MFRKFANNHTRHAVQTPALVGCLWFIHDTPGITEKVPYTDKNEMLNAIYKFLSRYGGDHDSEFLVIFCDNEYTKQEIQNIAKRITGYEYPINATRVANKLF